MNDHSEIRVIEVAQSEIDELEQLLTDAEDRARGKRRPAVAAHLRTLREGLLAKWEQANAVAQMTDEPDDAEPEDEEDQSEADDHTGQEEDYDLADERRMADAEWMSYASFVNDDDADDWVSD